MASHGALRKAGNHGSFCFGSVSLLSTGVKKGYVGIWSFIYLGKRTDLPPIVLLDSTKLVPDRILASRHEEVYAMAKLRFGISVLAGNTQISNRS